MNSVVEKCRTVAWRLRVWQHQGVNWHEVIEERSLELHQVVARELRADPDRLNRVTEWIERFLADPDYSVQGKDALTEWKDLIGQGLPRVLATLINESETGRRLRQSSPFAVIMPQEERMEIFEKYEARRTGTHPAGV